MKPLLAAIRKNSICAWESDFGAEPSSPLRKRKCSVVPCKEQNISKMDIGLANIKLPLKPSNKTCNNISFSKTKRVKTHCMDTIRKQKLKESNMTLPPPIQIQLNKSFFIWDKPDPLSIWSFRGLSTCTNYQRLCRNQQLQSSRSQSRAPLTRKIDHRHSKTSSISVTESNYFDPVEAVKKLMSESSQKKRKSVCLNFNEGADTSNQTRYIKRSWKNRVRLNSSVFDQ